MSSSTQTLLIRDIQIETHDARTFELVVPDSQRTLFCGRAGQFLKLSIPGDLPELARSYSLSSSPELGEPLRFTVKRIDGGVVSNRLSQMKVGDGLHVAPPAGSFTLRNSDLPLLLIAGGSGITPVFSILKTVLHTTKRTVCLLYTNRNLASAIFADQIKLLVEAFPERFSIRHHMSDDEGFLTESDLQKLISSNCRSHVYVCGPSPLMELVETALTKISDPDCHELICERFVSPITRKSELDKGDESAPTARVSVKIEHDEYHFSCIASQTLLEAGLRSGVPFPYSCKEGHCGACKVHMMDGEVKQSGAFALTRYERDRGYILACCSTPRSRSIIIEYD